MDHLALQTSGHFASSPLIFRPCFALLLSRFIDQMYAPCTWIRVPLTLLWVASSFSESFAASNRLKVYPAPPIYQSQITTCLSSIGPYALMSRTMLGFGPLILGLSELLNSQALYCLQLTHRQHLPVYVSPSRLPRLTHFAKAATSTLAEVILDSICALSALMPYLELHGSSPGPLFIRSNSQLLSRAFPSQWLKDTFSVLQLWPLMLVGQTILFKRWGGGQAMPTSFTPAPPAEALSQITPLLSH